MVIDNRYCDISGNPMGITCPFGNANPFRFSTKWFDAETGLGYWGYRYYSPRLGRWTSMDPVGDAGGFNLYGFATNEPINTVDLLGLRVVPCDNPSRNQATKWVTFPPDHSDPFTGRPMTSGANLLGWGHLFWELWSIRNHFGNGAPNLYYWPTGFWNHYAHTRPWVQSDWVSRLVDSILAPDVFPLIDSSYDDFPVFGECRADADPDEFACSSRRVCSTDTVAPTWGPSLKDSLDWVDVGTYHFSYYAECEIFYDGGGGPYRVNCKASRIVWDFWQWPPWTRGFYWFAPIPDATVTWSGSIAPRPPWPKPERYE